MGVWRENCLLVFSSDVSILNWEFMKPYTEIFVPVKICWHYGLGVDSFSCNYRNMVVSQSIKVVLVVYTTATHIESELQSTMFTMYVFSGRGLFYYRIIFESSENHLYI